MIVLLIFIVDILIHSQVIFESSFNLTHWCSIKDLTEDLIVDFRIEIKITLELSNSFLIHATRV